VTESPPSTVVAPAEVILTTDCRLVVDPPRRNSVPNEPQPPTAIVNRRTKDATVNVLETEMQ